MKLFCTAIILSLISVAAISSMATKNLPVQSSSYNSFNNPILKKSNVRLSPNPTVNGKIKVSSTIDEALHFYVFDLEGTLLYRIAFKGKEEKTITGLEKGIYMYDVFKNDESIEQGKIIAK